MTLRRERERGGGSVVSSLDVPPIKPLASITVSVSSRSQQLFTREVGRLGGWEVGRLKAARKVVPSTILAPSPQVSIPLCLNGTITLAYLVNLHKIIEVHPDIFHQIKEIQLLLVPTETGVSNKREHGHCRNEPPTQRERHFAPDEKLTTCGLYGYCSRGAWAVSGHSRASWVAVILAHLFRAWVVTPDTSVYPIECGVTVN